jgi:hypothetical protein
MTITVFIRYQIDPFQARGIRGVAQRWLSIIPTCGGKVDGYCMPHEAEQTGARANLVREPRGLRGVSCPSAIRRSWRRKFPHGREQRIIFGEERTFLLRVEIAS